MSPIRYRAVREQLGTLDCVVISPESAQASVAVGVFCHGFGAGGEDLVGLAAEILQVASPQRPVTLVCPAAPLSLDDQGMPGSRAWWLLSIQRLISALEEGRYEQVREEVPEGIVEARDQLSATIDIALKRSGLNESHLLLGGFSQGAMLSVETALLGLPHAPRQLCLYSGALICETRWKPVASRLNATTIFQSHGRMDPILPLQTGEWLCEMLKTAGCDVKFLEFNGPHTIPMAAIEQTAAMLAVLADDIADNA